MRVAPPVWTLQDSLILFLQIAAWPAVQTSFVSANCIFSSCRETMKQSPWHHTGRHERDCGACVQLYFILFPLVSSASPLIPPSHISLFLMFACSTECCYVDNESNVLCLLRGLSNFALDGCYKIISPHCAQVLAKGWLLHIFLNKSFFNPLRLLNSGKEKKYVFRMKH